MSEQREALAEALGDHVWLSSDEQKIDDEWTWGFNCDCGEFVPDAEANAHIADVLLDSPVLARLLADAEQRGADRVAAAVEAVLVDLPHATDIGCADRFGGCSCYKATIRAALPTDAADRLRAEACPSVLPLRYGSAACDLPDGHPGEHHQEASGRTWTTEAAENAQTEDNA